MNSSRSFSASPAAMWFAVRQHWQLIIELSKRDVLGRYRGSLMGLGWTALYPLLMLAVYTFVFSTVFKSRWGATGEGGKADFAIMLFTGLIVHGLFAENVNRAPGLILANPNYVKKVVFPLEVLPVVSMISALFHAAISLLVLLAANFVVNASLHWTAPLVILVLAPLVVAILGISWMLASLGVFIRDIGQLTGIVTSILLFLSPVFYPVSALPADIQFLFRLNPLTFPIEESRKVLILGVLPDFAGLSLYLLACLVAGFAGFWWFQKTRKGFADVI